MPQQRTISLEDFAQESHPSKRSCDHHGCQAEGLHRAPKGRDRLKDYYWFCLNHVQAYNKAWNYFAGMTTEEVEAHNRSDLTGGRPSWPMGALGQISSRETIHDPYGFFRREQAKARKEEASSKEQDKKNRKQAAVDRALSLFSLELPITLGDLKARYKTLVKRHHPDANGGDKKAEERLKSINEAYAVLKSFFHIH